MLNLNKIIEILTTKAHGRAQSILNSKQKNNEKTT